MNLPLTCVDEAWLLSTESNNEFDLHRKIHYGQPELESFPAREIGDKLTAKVKRLNAGYA